MPLCVVVDTREQRPFTFACIVPPPLVEVATLRTGDYSLLGYEDQVCVERKSHIDACGTFGQGRDRWERELERMRSYRFAAVILEVDWHTIVCRPPARSKLKPKTIHASIIAWQQRFGVHFWTCPNREFAERTTYRILERFWNDLQTGKIKI